MAVAVCDQHGRLLLQRRSGFGTWGLPGGVLDLGETITQCAHREVFEKTGLRMDNLELLGLYSEPELDVVFPNGDEVQQFTVMFSANPSQDVTEFQSDETPELRFFEPTDVPELAVWYQWMLADWISGERPCSRPPTSGDNPVPQIDSVRRDLGTAPYISAGAIGIVRDDQDRILMMKRADDGRWDFPGGSLDLGENAASTVVREVEEETGITVSIERLLGIRSEPVLWTYPNGDQTQSVDSVFLCTPESGEATPDNYESTDVAWVPIGDLVTMDLHPIQDGLRRSVLSHLSEGCFVIP